MTGPPINLAGATLGDYRHVCAFFHSDEERYRILLPFVTEGLERGEKALHMLEPARRDEHLAHLSRAGVDVDKALERGQLVVRDGHFDADRQLGLIKDALDGARTDGCPLRVIGYMEWAAQERTGVNFLLEYEARLNLLAQHSDAVLLCTYDCHKFGAGTVLDVLRTHPMAIIGDILQRNPFFVPPAELLEEFYARGLARRLP